MSGSCAGTPFTSDAAVLGRVAAFGSGPIPPAPNAPTWPSGVAAFLSEDRAIFADSSSSGVQLSLVDVLEGKLEHRDSLSSSLLWGFDQFSGWVFSSLPFLTLAPLSADRFIASSGSSVDLYGVEGGKLRLLAQLESSSGALGAAARGNRFWRCGRWLLNGIVDESDGLREVGATTEFGAQCLSLALTPDGGTLYAAGLFGLSELDPGAPGELARLRREVLKTPLGTVQATDELVAVQRIQDNSTRGDIVVYSRSNFETPLVTFEKWGESGMPLGFALAAGGIVLTRTTSTAGSIVAEYHELSPSGAELRSQLEIGRSDLFRTLEGSGVRLAASGRHVVTQPMRRMLHVESGSGALEELSGPEQGSFEWLGRADAGHVIAQGSHSAHRIDLSEPSSPRVVAGGLLPVDAEPLRIQLAHAPRRLPRLGPVRWVPFADGRLSLLDVDRASADAGHAPWLAGSVSIEGAGPGWLRQHSDSLYSFATTPDTTRVLEYSLRGLAEASEGERMIRPVREHTLDRPSDGSALVDPDTGDWLVIEAGEDARGKPLTLHRYRRTEEGDRVNAGSISLEGWRASGLAGSGFVALAVDARRLVLVENGDVLRLRAELRSEGATSFQRIVDSDRRQVAVATEDGRTGGVGLTVFRIPDLEKIAHYELGETPQALVSVGEVLAVATGNQLVTLSPRCPLEPPPDDCSEPSARRCGDEHTVERCSAASGRWEPVESCVERCDEGQCLTAHSVRSGMRHACAVLSDQTIRCWGQGDLLGNRGSASSSSSGPVAVLASDGLTRLTATELALGAQHTCARDQGAVACWGYSLYGALGTGEAGIAAAAEARPAIFENLEPITNAQQIAAGGHTTCVLLEDATVACFGAGSHGQLGNDRLGPSAHQSTASLVLDPDSPEQPLGSVARVAVGYLHACAALSDGTVRCWGNDELGQLGDGQATGAVASPLPRRVLAGDGQSPLSDVIDLAAGYTHTCALRGDQTVHCWGEGRHGELGYDPPGGRAYSPRALPVLDADGLPLARVQRIAAGWGLTCALDADSSVLCFGDGRRGERGDGSKAPENYGPVPRPVVAADRRPLSGVRDLAPGFHSLCLRNAASAVLCAGETSAEHRHGSNSSFPGEVVW